MIKKSIIQREVNKNILVNKFFKKRSELITQLKKLEFSNEYLEMNKKLQKLPRNSSYTRLRNRCWQTGRARGFIRYFGLSRNSVRELAHGCLLSGLIKDSW